MWTRRQITAALIGFCLAGPLSARAEEVPVTVFAAASLKTALDEAAGLWRKAGHPAPVLSYAASGALAKQIEAGAPADVFIGADLDWMDYLQGKSLIDPASRVALFGNRLVLIAPRESPLTARIAPGFALAGLIGTGRMAVGEARSVPAGKYARAALDHLGVWEAVSGHLAETDNVRAALALVSRGEASVGIVYQTDAAADPGVKVLDTFPADSHPAILYPGAVVAASGNGAARAFLAFLASEDAWPVFARQGFSRPAR